MLICAGKVVVDTILASTPTLCQCSYMILTANVWCSVWRIRRLARRQLSC